MGCCFSRSTGPNSPYPGGAPNSSARAINPPPLDLNDSAPATTSTPTPTSPTQTPSQSHSHRLDQHIDKPLRRHKWKSKSRRWTSRQLTRERRDFFDTRVTGRPEIWQTIHAALEALWADPTGQDPDALALAQTILSAAEISLPTGNLANGVYDSLGNFYALHAWVVCDPTNLAPDDEGDDGEGDDGEEDDEEGDANTKDILSSSGTRSTKDHPDGRNELNGDGDASAAAAGEQKGKAAAQTEEKVTLRIRLSENGRDYNVPVTMSESVRSVVKKAGQVVSLAPDKKIRLAYMGRLLRDNSSLESQGWQKGHVVNGLVFDRR